LIQHPDSGNASGKLGFAYEKGKGVK